MTSLLAAPSPTVAALDTSSDVAIETDGLTKTFGSSTVVEDLALRVPTGSVFGFLGPNGSGKTTTIRMLLGLLVPDDGAVRLLGSPIPSAGRKVLPMVGALIDGPAFYPWLSGRQNLWRIDAAGSDAHRSTRRARVSTTHWRVSGSPRLEPSATRRTHSACANGWVSPTRCCARARC